MLKVKKCEDEIKAKVQEFEEVFKIITEVKTDMKINEKKQIVMTMFKEQYQ